jgi:hypothetical protein
MLKLLMAVVFGLVSLLLFDTTIKLFCKASPKFKKWWCVYRSLCASRRKQSTAGSQPAPNSGVARKYAGITSSLCLLFRAGDPLLVGVFYHRPSAGLAGLPFYGVVFSQFGLKFRKMFQQVFREKDHIQVVGFIPQWSLRVPESLVESNQNGSFRPLRLLIVDFHCVHFSSSLAEHGNNGAKERCRIIPRTNRLIIHSVVRFQNQPCTAVRLRSSLARCGLGCVENLLITGCRITMTSRAHHLLVGIKWASGRRERRAGVYRNST